VNGKPEGKSKRTHEQEAARIIDLADPAPDDLTWSVTSSNLTVIAEVHRV
jgi:hypothetical protein